MEWLSAISSEFWGSYLHSGKMKVWGEPCAKETQPPIPSQPLRWLFYCAEEMSEQENYNGMLEFWEDLITLAKRREDYVALQNIPTDIYMMLGYDVKSMLGRPSEDEESGNILSDGCYRSEVHIYD
jgi:hypothetical protein